MLLKLIGKLAVVVVCVVLGTASSAYSQTLKAPIPSVSNAFILKVYPQDGQVIIGDYHSWIVHLEDSKGSLISNAKIALSGGMIDHGHGLPSKPQVTKYLGNGDYLVEGLLFNMSGQWTLEFHIQTPTQADRARIEFTATF